MDNLPARNALARNASPIDTSGSSAIADGPKDPPDSPNPPQNPSYQPDSTPEVIKSSTQDPVFHINLPPGYKPHPHPPTKELPASNTAPEGLNLPPIIEINHNIEPTFKKDPPAFGFFITNPVTYLKAFLKQLIKRQAITIRIPILAIIVFMVGIGGFGLGFQSGINWALFKIFPNYSPILHRNITKEGIIQKSSKGYFLQTNEKDKTTWTLQSVSANVKLEDYVNQSVQVKGNLTSTPNLIEVLEVTSFDAKPTPAPTVSPSLTSSARNASNSVAGGPNLPDSSALPALYSGLTWEITQSKTLLFTSGKRRIEQEGVYLESSPTIDYPQDFISYYTNELTNLGFKQTLNSFEPNGTTITYSKDDLFLTFGVKHVYSGSGDNKKITGYKSYIEHN